MMEKYCEIDEVYYNKLLKYCKKLGISFDRWNELHDPNFKGCFNCCCNLYNPANPKSDYCLSGLKRSEWMFTGGCPKYGVMIPNRVPYKLKDDTKSKEKNNDIKH